MPDLISIILLNVPTITNTVPIPNANDIIDKTPKTKFCFKAIKDKIAPSTGEVQAPTTKPDIIPTKNTDTKLFGLSFVLRKLNSKNGK